MSLSGFRCSARVTASGISVSVAEILSIVWSSFSRSSRSLIDYTHHVKVLKMLLSRWWKQQPLTRVFRSLTTSPTLHKHQNLPPRPTITEDEITEVFLKGSGPGGQKINKTSSAVQLKHLPTGMVVKSQETRSRSQNRKIARRVLAERLEIMEKGDESRTALKAERAKSKKASAAKKSKRKYRKLAEGKDGVDGEEREDQVGEEGKDAGLDDRRDATGNGHVVDGSGKSDLPASRSKRDPP